MPTTKFCTSCGSSMEANSKFCSSCGASQGKVNHSTGSAAGAISPKSGLTTFLLCLFLGNLGVHRFYVGKIGTGILMLLTGGGLGLWYLYDLISIVCNNFFDKNDQVIVIVKNPSTMKKALLIIGSLLAGFFVLMITIVIIVAVFVGSLADLGQKELAALRAGNLTEAYSYTSQEFQKSVSPENFKKFVKQYPQLENNVSASFPEREIKGNYGVITGHLNLKDGSEVAIEIRFVKENSEWKIIGIGLKNVGHSKEK